MIEIAWAPLADSILKIKLEKGDFINCLVKHPECHYERNIFCCDFDIKTNDKWFKTNDKGKCSYEEFLCYVFDAVFYTLTHDAQEIKDDCLLSKGIGPLSIVASLKSNDDLDLVLCKLKMEWDGNKIGKLCFTIL